MFRKLFPIFLVLVLLTACSIYIDIPVKNTGPEITDEISVPVPDSNGTTRLIIGFGAGELTILPGAETLVSGTATYNIEDLKPEVSTSGSTVNLKQGDYHITGLPSSMEVVNRWDLQLGDDPMDLEIEAGAYQAEYDLGGLALTNLSIQDGAADVEMAFSSPNLAEMSLLRYETGASSISLNGLANANFSNMQFEGGAGNFTLDFSGELKRDATVTIEASLGNLTLIIPENTPATIQAESGLSNLDIPSAWSQDGNIYTQTGSGASLYFVIQLGAANLVVRP